MITMTSETLSRIGGITAMKAAKAFFVVALLGVILNSLGCEALFSNLILWISGIVVFLIGAIGVLVNCTTKKSSP
jgi:hypothetical protein